jgi:phosphoglycerate dehydrogenase-like enzyme
LSHRHSEQPVLRPRLSSDESPTKESEESRARTGEIPPRLARDDASDTKFLISIACGPVVDEQALIEALQDGHLYGAGLDVFDPEPPCPDNPLLGMDNMVLTPHVGSSTDEGRRLMGLTVVEDIPRVLRRERPR